MEIPDKLFFRIGEVSEIVGVEPYVLRYWESEFPGLSPKKSSSGQRMFRRKDVDLLLNIKQLLYDKKFTIEGARKALQKPENPLSEIRKTVAEILQLLQ
jgi:DNA-binding transcriptional MerR regulator